MGLDLPSLNCFMFTKIDKIFIYSSDDYQKIGEMPVKLL